MRGTMFDIGIQRFEPTGVMWISQSVSQSYRVSRKPFDLFPVNGVVDVGGQVLGEQPLESIKLFVEPENICKVESQSNILAERLKR